jgi:phosphatidylglycerophosphate synthase
VTGPGGSERGHTTLGWEQYSAKWEALHFGAELRRSGPVVRLWLRLAYAVAALLVAVRVGPGTVTAAGVVLSAGVPIAAVLGGWWLVAAAALVVLAAIADSADGAVAVITGATSRRGSFYDAVADRLTEALWLLGLWLVGASGLLVVGCGALAWLHEYARARAIVAGMAGVGTITVAERPTRVIAVVAAFLVSGLVWPVDPQLAPGASTIVLAVWFVLGLLGAARLDRAIRTALR